MRICQGKLRQQFGSEELQYVKMVALEFGASQRILLGIVLNNTF